MLKKYNFSPRITVLAALLLVASCTSANQSVTVKDGETTGSHSTVNGSVSVGSHAEIKGSLNTVNGSVRVGHHTRLEQATTVNGSITIGDEVIANDVTTVNGAISIGNNSVVNGEITTVNGKIKLGKGSSVSKSVKNVNGVIQVVGAKVGGVLSTVNGSVLVTDGSIIEGDIVIEKSNGWGWWNNNEREHEINIGPNSKVLGNIVLEKQVKLFVSKSAEVGGITGVMGPKDVVWYEGSNP